MICQTCEQDPCTCPNERPRLPHPSTVVRSTETVRPWGITLDEFGTDLFDAIRLQSSIKTAFKRAEVLRAKDKMAQAEDVEREMVDVQKQFEAILAKNTIAPDDLRRLLAIP